MEFYIFGSLLRGEVTSTSDVDVLAIPILDNLALDLPPSWSIYSTDHIKKLYGAGKLFAWHLFYESKCVFTSNPTPYLVSLGKPAPYIDSLVDIQELGGLLSESIGALRSGTVSSVYELGLVYTCLRDISISASWHFFERPNFSQFVPYLMPISFPISRSDYNYLMMARHSSTRGTEIDSERTGEVVARLLSANTDKWVDALKEKVSEHIRR
ncbi:MAG: nucleotidyltransferase domain-containing protein [Gemmatales bacterium]